MVTLRVDDKPSATHWTVDLTLTVWSADDGWHARLEGVDRTPRDFVSPFELARYVARPFAESAMDEGTGLR